MRCDAATSDAIRLPEPQPSGRVYSFFSSELEKSLYKTVETEHLASASRALCRGVTRQTWQSRKRAARPARVRRAVRSGANDRMARAIGPPPERMRQSRAEQHANRSGTWRQPIAHFAWHRSSSYLSERGAREGEWSGARRTALEIESSAEVRVCRAVPRRVASRFARLLHQLLRQGVGQSCSANDIGANGL